MNEIKDFSFFKSDFSVYTQSLLWHIDTTTMTLLLRHLDITIMKQSHDHYNTKKWSKHTMKSMKQTWNKDMKQGHETRTWNKDMKQRHDHHDDYITITLLKEYIDTAHF